MPVYAPKDDFGAIRDFPGVRKWSLGPTFSAKNRNLVFALAPFLVTCFQERFFHAPGYHFVNLGWIRGAGWSNFDGF